MSAVQLELTAVFTPADLPANIARRVVVNDEGCWIFTGCVTSRGYGCAADGRGKGKSDLVHRIAYRTLVGPLTPGLVIDHTCHNGTGCAGGVECRHKRCCNPEHLEQVANRENVRRSHLTLADATHCPRGHSYADAYVRPNGRRECRTCRDEKRSSYYPRERAKYAAEHPVAQRRRKGDLSGLAEFLPA